MAQAGKGVFIIFHVFLGGTQSGKFKLLTLLSFFRELNSKVAHSGKWGKRMLKNSLIQQERSKAEDEREAKAAVSAQEPVLMFS